MTPDMAMLTGAYAVNALTGEERAAFEQHLAECEECTREVRELREAATRLGVAASTTPPSEFKQRVLDEIAKTRQEPPRTSDAPRPGKPRRRWATRLAVAAAAAGVALAGAFGAIMVREQQELSEMHRSMEQAKAHNAAMAEVMAAPDARMVSAESGHMRATAVVSHEMGKALFMGKGMEPPAQHSYQAWFIGPSGMTSAGVLQHDPAGMATVVSPMPADAVQMGITVEPAGGSVHPTGPPMLMVHMPA